MAITAVLDMRGRSGKPYLGTDTEITVPYIVYTENRAQGETDILNSGCLPARGDVFTENAYLAAFSVTLKREDQHPLIWRATVTFKTDSLDQKEKDKQLYPDPTTRPAEIEWDAVSYQVPAIASAEDYTPPGLAIVVPAGTPIVNSAWDQFEQPPEKTAYYWQATVTKLMPIVPEWLLDVAGTVNDAEFVIDGLTIPEGWARITGLRIGRRQRENGVNYREVRITIEFRKQRAPRTEGEEVPTPYILELENMGFNERDGSTYLRAGTTKGTPITDGSGKAIKDPVYLDANGVEFIDLTADNAPRRHYKIYTTADFSQLPLT